MQREMARRTGRELPEEMPEDSRPEMQRSGRMMMLQVVAQYPEVVEDLISTEAMLAKVKKPEETVHMLEHSTMMQAALDMYRTARH